MPFRSTEWDNKAFNTSEKYAAIIRAIYDQLVKDATNAAASVPNINTAKPFSFKDYPQIRDRVNKLFKKYAKDLEININDSTRQLWDIANKKNDALIEDYAKRIGEIKEKFRFYGQANKPALRAFQKRKDNGLGLSDRIWKTTQQAKSELELAIDVGLSEGKSAQRLSQDVRKLLNEPDRLFRRVRDKRGQLRLSKNAAAYHPGQGVYRSSFKNAMRLTRTENNMAYRTADYARWSEMTFVSGIHVKLSNNPNHCPTCVALQGKYPKDYKFVGWHPQCRCYAVPILLSDKDFNELELRELNGEDTSNFSPKNTVKDIPKSAKEWYNDNKNRIDGHKSLPYFLKDNSQYYKSKPDAKDGPVDIARKRSAPKTDSKALIKRQEDVVLSNSEITRALEEVRNKGLDQLPQFKKHSPAELAVMHNYTASGFYDLNRQLRDGTAGEYHLSMEGVLNRALEKLPTSKAELIHRGVGLDFTRANKIREHYTEGKNIVFDAFTSCSTNIETAKSFSGSHEVKVRLTIAHTTGKSIDGISRYGRKYYGQRSENEVLIKSKSKFKILDFSESDDTGGTKIWSFILQQID